MLDFVSSPYFVLFARLCVSGVFLASSAGKLLDREGTAAGMSRYTFLPIGSGRVIAVVLPWVELAVGLMLVLGVFTSLAALAATALFCNPEHAEADGDEPAAGEKPGSAAAKGGKPGKPATRRRAP